MQEQIPGFQLLARLGQTSSGFLIEARKKSIDRLVTILVLSPQLASVESDSQRFVAGARLAAKFRHENVLDVTDTGMAPTGIIYVVTEHYDGNDVQSKLTAGRTYSPHEAVAIATQVARALGFIHAKEYVHRNVKPESIALVGGVAKLRDFELARSTSDATMIKAESGMAVGTPYYMSPEQITRGDDVDGRADIYSLGATLYHMIAGRPPFDSDAVDEVFQGHVAGQMAPLDKVCKGVSPQLRQVVEVMMAKDPRRRYRTADDLLADLEGIGS